MAGSKGNAAIAEGNGKLVITGDNPWAYRGNHKNMYQAEHDVLFTSIRNGKPINNGDDASKSSLMAIMARMAAYTGQPITWQQALESKEDLLPAKYEWGPLPMPEVARPGITKFV